MIADDSFKITDEHGISLQLVQALLYIACLGACSQDHGHALEQQRQARAIDMQAGTYPSPCFPLCNMQSCHSPFFFWNVEKTLRVIAS